MAEDSIENILDELEVTDENDLEEIKDLDSVEEVIEKATIGHTVKPLPKEEPKSLDNIPAPKQEEAQVGLDLVKIMSDHERDYNMVIDNTIADRVKIAEAASMLKEVIETGVYKSTDMTAYTQLLSTLADTSGNVVRLMDSRSKMVSALKGTVISNLKIDKDEDDGEGNLNDMLSESEDEV